MAEDQTLTIGQRRLKALVRFMPFVFGFCTYPFVLFLDATDSVISYNQRRVLIIALLIAGITSSIVSFCILAYWAREHRRWLYGCFEVVFACLLMILTLFFNAPDRSDASQIWTPQFVTVCAQLAGAGYVMVRGLDNIGQGLRAYPNWNRWWRWFSLHDMNE